jgi:hypothetical protein
MIRGSGRAAFMTIGDAAARRIAAGTIERALIVFVVKECSKGYVTKRLLQNPEVLLSSTA